MEPSRNEIPHPADVNLICLSRRIEVLRQGDAFMKFILLKSRGGDYLVVAENVAWLRAHENGQTQVGVIGGAPILVAGGIDETAAAILAG
jgi:hypothetical protein